jgi:hypothetical protein
MDDEPSVSLGFMDDDPSIHEELACSRFLIVGFLLPEILFLCSPISILGRVNLGNNQPKKQKKKNHISYITHTCPKTPIHFSHTCPHSCPKTPYISHLPAPITPSISRTILQYLPERKKGARNEKKFGRTKK